MPSADEVKNRIEAAIPGAEVDVQTADEVHFSALVRASAIEGLSRVQQHRLVMEVFEDHGLRIIVDSPSLPYVRGSIIDWVDSLQGAGFQVNNPNVVAACGCGSSFQVKEDAAEQAATV